jgi:hypothetical protein
MLYSREPRPPPAGLSLCIGQSPFSDDAAALFAEMTTDCRNRGPDRLNGRREIVRRDAEPIGPVVSLAIVCAVDDRRRPSALRGFRRQNR